MDPYRAPLTRDEVVRDVDRYPYTPTSTCICRVNPIPLLPLLLLRRVKGEGVNPLTLYPYLVCVCVKGVNPRDTLTTPTPIAHPLVETRSYVTLVPPGASRRTH